MERGDKLLTLDEAARVLTISKATLWRMIKKGELPVVKISERGTRIKLSDIEGYVSKHYITGIPSEEKESEV